MDAMNGEPSGDAAAADAQLLKSIIALVPAADNEVYFSQRDRDGGIKPCWGSMGSLMQLGIHTLAFRILTSAF